MAGPAKTFLPYGRQFIDDDDVAAVTDALKGDYLTTGPLVDEFERRFADAVAAPHAVACSSGTAALHLSVLSIGLGPGDLALVPAVTFSATANVALYAGADVEFIDVEPDTGLMDLDKLAERLEKGPGAKAVLPVHLAGQCVDMIRLREIADAHGLRVVEDACHALGGTYGPDDTPVGAAIHSDAAMFSTHPVKIITTGEGGVITTRDEGLAERMRLLRNHGLVREAGDFTAKDLAFDNNGAANPWYYELQELGLNYRLSDINCALGISQLKKLPRFADARRKLVDRYDGLLADLAPSVMPLGRKAGCNPVWHLYVVLIDFEGLGLERAEVMTRLRGDGIGTQVHYIPVPWLPFYRERAPGRDFPGAQAYYARALSLPLFPAMSDDDPDRVVEALGRAISA
ncbi:MAG: UDP-4-amino-4,6-dideoxy-N-acetyl-beta-L-altrosamine transaminase [Rhodospirillales bacterium]